MAMRLYDLAGADASLRFSPYCWRAKLALAHKGLAVETIPWRFTEKDAIAFSGQDRVPVLVDGGKTIPDSWTIATYLDEAYADRPSLFGGPAARTATRFLNSWADTVLNPGIVRFVVADVFRVIHPKDRDYFRTSREKRFGMSIEAYGADRDKHLPAFRQNLAPVRTTLAVQPYLAGERPAYADYIVFGGFPWARCISTFPLLEADDPIVSWRDRMLDAFDGLARRALAA
jgi:glutathione S-transferase